MSTAVEVLNAAILCILSAVEVQAAHREDLATTSTLRHNFCATQRIRLLLGHRGAETIVLPLLFMIGTLRNLKGVK